VLQERSKEVEAFIKTKFNHPSLKMFLAVVICLENSFWDDSKLTFIKKFCKAFDLYEHTGTQAKLEGLQLIDSSVYEILLEHRLSHSN